MKQKLKNEKGITLVALVITIIVLLILAGVTLSMVMGESGIFGKANSAKEKTQLSNAEETIKLAVLENQVKSVSGDAALTNDQLKEEIAKKLTEQGYTVSGSKVTYYGDKTIDIENYLEKESTSKSYNIGDSVTIGSEEFFVISDKGTTVELLAKYVLNSAATAQENKDTDCAFSTDNYWKNETLPSSSPYFNLNTYQAVQNDTGSAVYKANSYAKSLGATSGRLLTYEEANSLKDSYSDIIFVTYGASKFYWLGSAHSTGLVWRVRGSVSDLYSNYFSDASGCGVRPVVEISKDLIK